MGKKRVVLLLPIYDFVDFSFPLHKYVATNNQMPLAALLQLILSASLGPSIHDIYRGFGYQQTM